MVDATKKQDESKPIELRSEKVRNIIGQIPPFLIRSGIGVISIVIVIALAVCYFIPYYETTQGNINIISNPPSIAYTSPMEGIFNASSNLHNGSYVGYGDTLGYIEPLFAGIATSSNPSSKGQIDHISTSTTADCVIWIISGISGKLLINAANGERIAKEERLLAIIPDSITAFYGQITLPYRLPGQYHPIQTQPVEKNIFNGIGM